MANRILKICEDVLKIKDNEIEEMRRVIETQLTYNHPLKMATVGWQRSLGEHNNKVLNKLLELKAAIEEGALIDAPSERR